MSTNIIGWDIGGAHLKAVLLVDGDVISSIQLPCLLWKGLDYLQRAIIDALQALSVKPSSACHAITMTGELVDLFENRHEGVCEITKTAADLLGKKIWFYAANANFVQLQQVAAHTASIASTNWHASASALAMHVPNALFVDIGSTTTDIIGIKDGKPMIEGLSDAYRLAADSLVYTGVVRTPVMALAQKLPVAVDDTTIEVNVAAEYFATMGDVYRLTGELATSVDLAETADGKGKTALESARRLARMVGYDVVGDLNQDSEKWINLAFACRSLQIQQIKTAMLKQLKPNMTIIGAGAGSFLVKAIAADLDYSYISASSLVSMPTAEQSALNVNHNIDDCFPAYAVAYLAHKESIC